MAHTSTNVHNVTGISVIRVHHGDFVSHQFTFWTNEGGRIEVNAFAESPLEIEISPDQDSQSLIAQKAAAAVLEKM